MKIFKGPIITCDEDDTVHKYLVEDNKKIVFTGDVLPEKYMEKRIIDLGNKALIPSFSDSHLHFSSYALFSSTLDVRDAKNFQDLSNIIKCYIEKSKCKIVLGFGISAHHVEEKRLVTREELDLIENRKPVMLIKYDGHASVVNTAMLKILPPKIKKLRGYNDDTGQLFQEAFFAATDHITSKVSVVSLLNHMLKTVDKMAEKGIGLVHPAEGVGFPLDLDVDLVRFMAGGLANPFNFRVFFQTMDIKKVLKRKLPRIGGCFATALDGCFGSLDAALNTPYQNDTKNKGILFYTDDQVINFVKKANDKNLQVQLHAIGDAAFDQATKAFETALKSNFRKDHRHSIIHGSLVTPKGLEKCARYNIGIAAQPSLLRLSLEPLSYLSKILGKRALDISPFRTMLDMGIHISGGSDAPVTLPDPVFGIYCACNHYNESQSVSVMEAIKMFTYETAFTCFDDEKTGSLEPGKKADMVVLDKNPLTMKKEDLAGLKTRTLYLEGKEYQKGQGLSSLLWNGIFRRRT
ncbi:MAG: amidohydrolase [Deltaproteobacteria bacterium]|nr:amidohydrolase [Deltaproteobacteria bacterium]